MDDLHPYDGRERRFHDSDPDLSIRARGRALVRECLHLPGPPDGLRFDLQFYSGGTGVFDKLRAALPCTPTRAAEIAAHAGFLALDAPWPPADRDELEWLLGDDDPTRKLTDLVHEFITDHRASFQPPPGPETRVWFTPGSDVNSWSMLYTAAGELAYLAEDQG